MVLWGGICERHILFRSQISSHNAAGDKFGTTLFMNFGNANWYQILCNLGIHELHSNKSMLSAICDALIPRYLKMRILINLDTMNRCTRHSLEFEDSFFNVTMISIMLNTQVKMMFVELRTLGLYIYARKAEKHQGETHW